jgi:hypothetical protein
MVYWNRFISYIFRYHNYEKCENAGFAKIQKIEKMGYILFICIWRHWEIHLNKI